MKIRDVRNVVVMGTLILGGMTVWAGDAPPALPTVAEIQTRIDAAFTQGGGEVSLPAGTYSLRRGLVLKHKVKLVGAGMDKTVLSPGWKTGVMRISAIKPGADTHVWSLVVDGIPADLKMGQGLIVAARYPVRHILDTRQAEIVGLDAASSTITIRAPLGIGNAMRRPTACVALWGAAYVLAREVKKGDTEVELRSAEGIQAGDELTLGVPENESMLRHVFVKAVEGTRLILESPARADYRPLDANTKTDAGLVWMIFPMIHGAGVDGAAIRDLTVMGRGVAGSQAAFNRYTVAGIHLFGTKNLEIERVAVRDWHTDGISIQTADDLRVAQCEVTGCGGNGFHPGTTTRRALFESNLATNNAVGLYFCWSNCQGVYRKNRFIGNREGGITGLGNPHERDNRIEENIISDNGGAGIQINGGLVSGNVISGNVIENNSRAKPGEAPGIAVYASQENAMGYTIVSNQIRDTQSAPTQQVGIEERHGNYRGKPTQADANVIRHNTFSGMRRADIILAGSKTVVENAGARIAAATAGGKNEEAGDGKEQVNP